VRQRSRPLALGLGLFLALAHLAAPPPASPAAAANAVRAANAANAAKAAKSVERWTIDDLVLAEGAEDWTLSPAGDLAAWVKTGAEKAGDEEEARVANLWLTHLRTAESIELTRGTDLVARPAFSPDGKELGFLSNRPLTERKPGAAATPADTEEADTQLWVIPVGGGEAFPVTHFDRDVLDFDWIDDDTLLVLARESPSFREQEKKERQDTAIVVDDAENEPPVRLFRVSKDGREVHRLTANDDWIDSIDVSPDGRFAVASAEQSLSYKFDQKIPPRTYLIDVATGSRQRLFEGAGLVPHDVRWAPDSSGFYFANDRSSHPTYRTATVTDLHWYDLADGRAERIDLGWERGLGTSYAATPGGFLALLADGVHQRAARYTRTGSKGAWKRQDLTGKHAAHLDNWTTSRDGRTVVYQTSTATVPPAAYVARLDGLHLVAERRIADLSPGSKGKPTGQVEIVHWPGAKGDTVEGLLFYPLDYKPGEKRPLILEIHGGPNECDRDAWRADWSDPTLLWRQRGAFVLEANYHGSSCYGLPWVESIAGHYYELEIPDLEAGVDAVIARGLADPERLASAGWSNGGILTVELLTRSKRYRAASVGAADVEWISDWGNVDFGASFDNYYFGAPPWEKPQVYVEKSPFFRLPQVTTPTLVFAGTEDRNVPPHESWSLFRALQQIGKAPTRLVLFPGEPHSLEKAAHQRRKLQEELDWFDRYLFGKPRARRPAVKDGSPLWGLLGRAKAARSGSAFGRLEGGVLLPETVPFHGLEVGRFEVTRAQFAAFDPSLRVDPESENLPMTGISYERAKEYVAWLAKTSGKPFRLPTEEEARDLAEQAGGGGNGGNTLDRWAGYAPNPHDRKEIETELKALPGKAPLLLPVGSLAGAGDDPVFDLDGNAAEWAVGDKGKGLPVGPSADRPTDPRSDDLPGAEYIGLRVVRSAR
jgi:dipeptidyl aminopeptidase/acylaminoacyl peptidase